MRTISPNLKKTLFLKFPNFYLFIFLSPFLKFSIFSKILFTNVHLRHGARSSLMKIGELGYDFLGQKWAHKGDLTPVGMRMLYLNGLKHRERYKNLISEDYYDSHEILVYSTSVNRTMQSASTYLSGLYSNIKNPKLSSIQEQISFPPGEITSKMEKEVNNLNRNVIPDGIQTIPIRNFQYIDHFFLLHDPPTVSNCKPIGENRAKRINGEKISKVKENFYSKYGKKIQKFYEDKVKGYNENIFNKKNIYPFCDHFISNKINGTDLSFLNEYDINIKEMSNDCYIIMEVYLKEIVGGSKEIVMMSESPSMRQIITWMEKRINLDLLGRGDESVVGSPKYTVWSGHDTSTCANEMFMHYTFGTKFIYPKFGSSILFELHKNEKFIKNKNNEKEDRVYVVKYFVNDELLFEMEFFKFKNIVIEKLWSNEQIDDYCQFTINNYSTYIKKRNKYLVVIGTIGIILVVSLFANVKLCVKLKQLRTNKLKNFNEYELKEDK